VLSDGTSLTDFAGRIDERNRADIQKVLSLEYARKRSEARHAGLDFALSKDEFVEIVLSPCIYCGGPPTKVRSLRDKGSAYPAVGLPYIRVHGIDRAKSSRGYTKENSLPCCWVCNRAKSDMQLSKFEEWICCVYRNRGSWSYLKELHRPSLKDIGSRRIRKKRRKALRLRAEVRKRLSSSRSKRK
jgi:hypothetical protein